MSVQRQRGDTIIEVLFAVTIFSLLAVVSLSIMSKGVSVAQRSLEITLVRQQMDTQADLVRLAHNAYINDIEKTTGPGVVWRDIKDSARTSGSLASVTNPTTCPTNVPGSFVVARTAPGATALTLQRFNTLPRASVYSRVDVDKTIARAIAAEGLWMQAVRVPAQDTTANVDAYDVYIRACWDSVGNNLPVVLGTIVRLYEPLP